jgi:hypothetical protein
MRMTAAHAGLGWSRAGGANYIQNAKPGGPTAWAIAAFADRMIRVNEQWDIIAAGNNITGAQATSALLGRHVGWGLAVCVWAACEGREGADCGLGLVGLPSEVCAVLVLADVLVAALACRSGQTRVSSATFALLCWLTQACSLLGALLVCCATRT